MDNYKFPKYARLFGPDSTLMMRTSISKDGFSATYYRPCGEWGCSIKLNHYEYMSDDVYLKCKKFNIVACSPREFIRDNSYCVLSQSKLLFDEAIEDIKKTETTFKEGYVTCSIDKNGISYIPIVHYKEYQRLNSKEKFINWQL